MDAKMQIRLPKEMYEKFKVVADRNAQVPSLLVRKWIEDYIKKEKMKVENINQIIKEVENFKRELDDSSDPSYIERDYTDGATEVFAEFPVDGAPRLTVVFAEQDHVKEMRNREYDEEITTAEFEDYMQGLNEINDQFDFDKVVGYRWEVSEINWI